MIQKGHHRRSRIQINEETFSSINTFLGLRTTKMVLPKMKATIHS